MIAFERFDREMNVLDYTKINVYQHSSPKQC